MLTDWQRAWERDGLATWVARAALEQAHLRRPEVPVVAYLLAHNQPSGAVAREVGLELVHQGPDAGNPDPGVVRLVHADRTLTDEQLAATLR